MTWEVDGADVPIEDISAVAYRTQRIESFLHSGSSKRILSGSKGMGKTLLLSLKRAKLFAEYGSERERTKATVCFIPVNRPYLDCMSPLPDLDRQWIEALGDCVVCERIWALAFRLSALSHLGPGHVTEAELGFPGLLSEWVVGGAQVAPTLVCRELLTMSVSQFQQLYKQRWNRIDFAFRKIQSAMFLFVDKIDQACSDLKREAWISFQNGLLMAIAELPAANAHVKAYGTIRQEAFANLHRDRRANAMGVITELSYTDDELSALLDRLARFYERDESFGDFVGRESVINTMAQCREESYHYIRRHTLYRPRDLVSIAEGLSLLPRPITQRDFKACVNRRASQISSNEVFNERRPFLTCLRTPQDRADLFALLPFNILTLEDLQVICRRVNGDSPIEDFASDGILHPFCELYGTGLLGVPLELEGADYRIQRFKRPSDPSPVGRRDLPHSDYYLVHPGLMDVISRENPNYRVLKFLPIGDDYQWGRGWHELTCAQREFFSVSEQLDEVTHDQFWELASYCADRLDGRGIESTVLRIERRRAEGLFHLLMKQGRMTGALVWLEELLVRMREDPLSARVG